MKVFRILCAVILCFWTVPGFSQEQPSDTMAVVRDALKSEKKAFIAVNMGLAESEGEKFWPVYESYQADMEKLNKRLVDLIMDYAAHYENLSEEKAKQLLDESLALDDAITNLKKSYVSKFTAALPLKKVARYYQLENKIQAVLRFDLAQKIPLVK